MIRRAPTLCTCAMVMIAVIAPTVRPDPVRAESHDRPIVLASGTTTRATPMTELTPEERMRRRYPQPVKVGDLIGLPVLDDDDRTLGRIRAVVRTADGKIQLIVPYGGFLGFGRHLVAVPIEVVAIAGRQLAALDMPRAAFDAAPAWVAGAATTLTPTETIRIALYKR